ncbi:sulfate transporter family-domain-containing protein [Zychaea mexicana]|uniref:sulfate transporter family-domain-containing protein n=1 Tax=Zychaea mexicana TaxID=64656 RepID=UPI0022FF001A|nr:sulfate transporter family-domain-containing protein [Zychaea mexicana]KAI9491188.1 sulfate transporter family-domain-containing protein [Zychaea mexicana]
MAWSTLKTRLIYYIPMLQWLPYYTTQQFTADILSGLSISSLFIPQALSYATGLCRLPAIHGLYTISISTLVYACLGMSPQLSVGPEATVSLMVGAGIAHQKPMDPETAAAIASLTALFVGLFTLGLGLLRFGFLDSLMSRALLRGFITGVAVVVLIQQTVSLLGMDDVAKQAGIGASSASLERVAFIATHLEAIHPPTALFSACVLCALVMAPFIKRRMNGGLLKRIPEVLLVVIVSTAVCRIFRLDKLGIDVLGQVGSQNQAPLPLPSWPSLPEGADIKSVVVNAAVISTVGFVESIAAAKMFARKHNYFVSANRELVALGTANVIGSMFQTFPAFGSLSRSKVHEAVNPQTQMSGLVSGIATLVVTGLLLPQFYYLPQAMLSSIIFMAVMALLHELPHDLKFMWKMHAWQDIAMLATTFTTTMAFSLEYGTAIAVLFSLIITIRQTSYPRITVMGRVKETLYKFGPIKNSRGLVEHLEEVLIVRVEEPLYFVNTGQLKDRLRRIEHYGDLSVHPSEAPLRSDENLSYIIFDLAGMETIDASAVQILYEIFESYHARDIHVYIVKVHPNAMPLLERGGLLDLIGRRQLYTDVADAIQAVEYDISSI